MKKHVFAALFLLGVSGVALAHPGHELNGAYAGFMHPLTGLDHLLVMLAVGLWAGKLGGNSRWQLPMVFLLMMVVGSVLGIWGLAFTGLETAVAATVMAMGFLLLISQPLSSFVRFLLVASFAMLHGMAHGAELPMQATMVTLAGMLVATAMLHGLGLVLSLQRLRIAKAVHSVIGLLMVSFAAYLLIA